MRDKLLLCLLSLIRIVLYYPLSGFLTLFANILQNPQDSQVASDLKLMGYITSFLSPSVVQLSPLTASASIIIRELSNIAAKFIEKINLRDAKPAKRVRDGQNKEDPSYPLHDIPEMTGSMPYPDIYSEISDTMVCISLRHLFQVHWLVIKPYIVSG
jgi:hypothetical protein